MSPEDIATMKLTRKDLVKACAAKLLAELQQEIDDAAEAHKAAEVRFSEAVEHEARERFRDVICKVDAACNGRSDRIEVKVCADILPSVDIPEYAAVIFTDGTSYDNNFRLQFHVRIDEELWVAANDVKEACARMLKAQATSQKVSDLDNKAREQLIADALDSTEHGAAALESLKRMRADLKKNL